MCEIPAVVWVVQVDRFGDAEIEMPFFFEKADAERVAEEKNANPYWHRRSVVSVEVK